jgi:hypothetical protein
MFRVYYGVRSILWFPIKLALIAPVSSKLGSEPPGQSQLCSPSLHLGGLDESVTLCELTAAQRLLEIGFVRPENFIGVVVATRGRKVALEWRITVVNIFGVPASKPVTG